MCVVVGAVIVLVNNTLVSKGTHELYLHLGSWLFWSWWNFISRLYWKYCHFVTHINSIEKVVFFGKILRVTKTKIKLPLFPSSNKSLTPSLLIFSSFPNFQFKNSVRFLCICSVFLLQGVTFFPVGVGWVTEFVGHPIFLIIFHPFLTLLNLLTLKLFHSISTVSLY